MLLRFTRAVLPLLDNYLNRSDYLTSRAPAHYVFKCTSLQRACEKIAAAAAAATNSFQHFTPHFSDLSGGKLLQKARDHQLTR